MMINSNAGISSVLYSFAFCLVFYSSTSIGQDLVENYPETYIVVEGDTLWDISSQFLQDPWLWPEVWQANPQVDDPDLIYPGDVIRLINVNGTIRIVLDRGNRKTVKLSPQIREMPLSSAIPAIPLEAIDGSLVKNRIVPEDALENTPYVLSSTSKNLLMGAGDQIFARGDWSDSNVSAFEIFRPGTTYIDPETKEGMGFEIVNLGYAEVLSDGENNIKRLVIRNSNREITVGDYLLPRENRRIDPTFFPTTPNSTVSGKIIGLMNDESLAAQYNSVVLNLGQQDGLRVGDLLAIHQPGNDIKDKIAKEKVQLPSKEIGLVLTYRTYERISYGVILTLNEPASIGDLLVNP